MRADTPADRPDIGEALASVKILSERLSGVEEWLTWAPDHPGYGVFPHEI